MWSKCPHYICYFTYCISFLQCSCPLLIVLPFPSACFHCSKPLTLLPLSLHLSLPLFLCYSSPMSSIPHNNRIARCDRARVPAQWMKLSWFPWGSERAERHTHTLSSFTIWYYYRKSRVDQHPCCVITHTYTYIHPSSLKWPWLLPVVPTSILGCCPESEPGSAKATPPDLCPGHWTHTANTQRLHYSHNVTEDVKDDCI